MAELLAGVVVAAAALAVVLEPLVRVVRPHTTTPAEPPLEELEFADPEESESPKVQALVALREIEFDRATGKLSDDDYATLKAKYASKALAAMDQEDTVRAETAAEDPAEAAVKRARDRMQPTCPVCGPRPEDSAKFCSQCGRSLQTAGGSARCNTCGATVPEGARFCGECGGEIAA